MEMPETLKLAGAGLLQMAPALTNVGIAIMAAGGPMVAIGALKTALMSMSVLLTLPAGLVVAAVVGLVAVFMNWDKISAIAQRVYAGVKEWLVDKFAAVIASIKAKVDAVTGFFGDMYDKVVGRSFVPDMVNGIASEFGRLDSVMVGPTSKAVGGVMGVFQNLAQVFSGGAGGVTSAVKSMATNVVATLTNMIPVVGPIISQFSGVIMDGLSKIGGFFKGLFGGPSAEELGGREVAEAFRANLERMLTDGQRLEAGNDKWKRSVIAIRDAYIAAGRTEAEALQMSQRLWEAEKRGPQAVKAIIEELSRVINQGLTPALEKTGDAAAVGFAQATDNIWKTYDAITAAGNQLAAFNWNTPGAGKDSSGNPMVRFTGANLTDAAADFLRRNPGDTHRIGSALGVSTEDLRRAGVPGFQGGTHGRYLPFGAGTPVIMHGNERISTEAEGRAENRRFDALEDKLDRLIRDLPRAIGRKLTDGIVLAPRRRTA
jgi:hypothetical protein